MAQITLTDEWRRLNGYAHGLPQQPLLGRIRVHSARPQDLPALDALLLRVVPSTALPDPQGNASEAFARRFFFWVGEIQRHARVAVSPDLHLRPITAADDRGGPVFEVALPCRSMQASRLTMRWLEKAVNHALGRSPTRPTPLDGSLNQLLEQLKAHAEPGYNRLHLLLAAYRLGLPVQTVAARMLRLGTGARARLMHSSLTDLTPALGLSLAQDKWLTSRMLAAIGIPATRNDRVKTADEAVALAHRLGWPVVVKPADKDQGLGVSAHLVNDEGVRKAFDAARAASAQVLVESHVHGFGYRFTLHEDELLAVLKRIPGGVHGDGRHTVAELVARQLASPEVRRQRNMGRVSLDDEALGLMADRGLGPDSVPAAGDFVLMRRRDNLSAGGRFERVDPATVHPDNLLAARRAAKALHLDIAGIDFISPDITRSWRTDGGAICEVNAKPQFGVGALGDNYDHLLRRLLGDPLQIPVHLYLCRGPDEPALHDTLKALCTRLGAQALSHARGVWLNGTILFDAPADGWQAARAALADRDVPSLVMALSPREVVVHGLPVPRLDSLHMAPGRDDDWPADERAVREQALQWCARAPDHLSPLSPDVEMPTT